MATGTVDQVLNFAVPAILIVIAVGFIYTKFLEPWVLPMLAKFWEKIKGTPPEQVHIKELTFE